MASNQTPVYGLNQWSLTDGVIMEEFNEDNAKTEQALLSLRDEAAALKQTAQGLQAEHATLEQALTAAKAEAKSGDDTLLQALNTVKAAIPNIATGSYVGTGAYGESAPTSLTLSFAPKLLIVALDIECTSNQMNASSLYKTESTLPLIFIRGVRGALMTLNDGDEEIRPVKLTWNGNTVSWYSTKGSHIQLNASAATYRYFAIG